MGDSPVADPALVQFGVRRHGSGDRAGCRSLIRKINCAVTNRRHGGQIQRIADRELRKLRRCQLVLRRDGVSQLCRIHNMDGKRLGAECQRAVILCSGAGALCQPFGRAAERHAVDISVAADIEDIIAGRRSLRNSQRHFRKGSVIGPADIGIPRGRARLGGGIRVFVLRQAVYPAQVHRVRGEQLLEAQQGVAFVFTVKAVRL